MKRKEGQRDSQGQSLKVRDSWEVCLYVIYINEMHFVDFSQTFLVKFRLKDNCK